MSPIEDVKIEVVFGLNIGRSRNYSPNCGVRKTSHDRAGNIEVLADTCGKVLSSMDPVGRHRSCPI